MFENKAYTKVECGLVATIENKISPIPLVSVDVLATVVHAIASVEINQVYVNKEENPIEAIYFFPVDSNGGVIKFQAELEGRLIKSIVKESSEAKADYENAINDGLTAFLAELNKPDILKFKVGSLKPGSLVKISITYATEIKNENNSIRFFIPTTVAPRYVPVENNDEKSNELRNWMFSKTSQIQIKIKVKISLQGKIKSIESPSHSITVTESDSDSQKPNWTNAIVELKDKTTEMNRDFVLIIKPCDKHVPKLYVEKLEDSVAVMIHMIPNFKLNDQKTELIFVLDRSGSMRGESIGLAKGALSFFLHSMPMDCYFNIVGFGTKFEFLFPQSIKYDDTSLKLAIEYSKKIEANFDGTEILKPLKSIFNKKMIPGYLRQIFILTDGQVGNTDEVIKLIGKYKDRCRVFSLGIGLEASHYLVDSIAEAGNGVSSFVTCGESFNEKVLHLLKNAIQPGLKDVKITWRKTNKNEFIKEKTLMGNKTREKNNISKAGIMFIQAPERIQPISDQSQMIVFGIFIDDEIPQEVTITAKSPEGQLSTVIGLSEENDMGKTGLLHKLASIRIIKELEMKIIGDSRGGYSKNSLKESIVKIACKEGLLSVFTSFVAVVENPFGEILEENWALRSGLCEQNLFHLNDPASCQKPRKSAAFSLGCLCCCCCPCFYIPYWTLKKLSSALKDLLFSERDNAELPVVPFIDPDVNTETENKSQKLLDQKSPLERIVNLQSFDGSFTLDLNFSKAIEKPLELLVKEAVKNSWDEKCWATALAISYMNEILSNEKDSWVLIETKANLWLNSNVNNSVKMLAESKIFLKN